MAGKYHFGEPILLVFEVENTSDRALALLKWDTPLEGEVLDYLDIRHRGIRLAYDGLVVKRGEPADSSYLALDPGETATEEVDLSTAFEFSDPGFYTVTFHPRFQDAIADLRGPLKTRPRVLHESLELEPLSASFELEGDGIPRQTSGQLARERYGTIERPREPLDPLFHVVAPAIVGGTPDQQAKVRTAHENAAAYVNASVSELGVWSWWAHLLAHNRSYTEWFGDDQPYWYGPVQSHYSSIRAVLASNAITYNLTGGHCHDDWYAYTQHGSRQIWLCFGFWTQPETGLESQFGTLIHELSHAVAQTDDVVEGRPAAKELAHDHPADAIRNADNHEYYSETVASRLLRAPVVWNNRTAYFFVAGQYYRWDIPSNSVAAGMPRSIASGFSGLWSDRLDAVVLWPNNKAYFFRDSQYMRYDIATNRVDPGYPAPIEGHWPGLWADGVDAAVMWPTNGRAYFFRGSEYVRYNVQEDKVDPGYPQPIGGGNWNGLWGDGLTGAVAWPNGKAYFFRGWEYMQYDIAIDQVDEGYPKTIVSNWSGLPGVILIPL